MTVCRIAFDLVRERPNSALRRHRERDGRAGGCGERHESTFRWAGACGARHDVDYQRRKSTERFDSDLKRPPPQTIGGRSGSALRPAPSQT